jgi:hypothetical protein
MITYLRSFRILNMAIFDWLMTIIAIYYLDKYKVIKWMSLRDYYILLIPTIIIFHKLFGVNSTLVKFFDSIIQMN